SGNAQLRHFSRCENPTENEDLCRLVEKSSVLSADPQVRKPTLAQHPRGRCFCWWLRQKKYSPRQPACHLVAGLNRLHCFAVFCEPLVMQSQPPHQVPGQSQQL